MASSPDKTEAFYSCDENTSNDMTEDMGDVVDDGGEPQVGSDAKGLDDTDVGSGAIPSNEDSRTQSTQSESKPNDDTNDVPIAEPTNVEQDYDQSQEDPPGDQIEPTLENQKIFKRSRSIDDEEADEDKSQKDTSDDGETGDAREEPDAEEGIPTTDSTCRSRRRNKYGRESI